MKNFKIFISLLTLILLLNISSRILAQGLKKDSIWILKTDSVRMVTNFEAETASFSRNVPSIYYHILNFKKMQITLIIYSQKDDIWEYLPTMHFSSIENTKSLIAFLENSNQYKVLFDKNPFHSIGYLDSKKGIMYLYSNVKKVSKLEIDKLKTHK